VLHGLRDAAAGCARGEFPAGLGQLDERLARAASDDLAALLALVLSAVGRTAPHGAPDGYRETGADTLFGHVRFTCAYYGPAPEKAPRQARRARERAAAKGRRQAKNGKFPRTGEAASAFPLKEELGLHDGMTPALADRLQRAAVAAGSFAEGAALLALLSGVRMSGSTFRRRALAAGARKGRPARDPGCESHIVSPKTASEFGSLLRRLAFSRGLGSGRFRIQVVGDGADWVANIVRDAFPGADVVFTCDFYHACEHLREFLGIALPQKDVKKAFGTARAVLRRHGGASLLKHLRKRFGALPTDHPAWEKLPYFEKRKDNMRYGEYRKQGLYIGSGVVEAACRTDVARRCKQSGMHWRFHNAAAICALTARLNSRLPAA